MAEEKTALVLSAGGMFGAYQAGAYKAIADHISFDLVVGASVGALNGWPIAARCSPRDLVERWLDPAAGAALKLYDPEPLRRYSREVFNTYDPVVPFGVVVIERPWFRTALVQTPCVTAEHLQASCSVPLFLPPVKIGSTRCIDGGLFEKLPIWAAIEMGATHIVAVDALPDLGLWWLRAGVKVIRLFRARRRIPHHVQLTFVSPSECLGTARDAVFWKRDNVRRWIELGQKDAGETLQELLKRQE